MHKLTVYKLELVQKKTLQAICETEVGELTGDPRLIASLMADTAFVNAWRDTGATHWQLTEVFDKPVIGELPENFYNKTNYHEGE